MLRANYFVCFTRAFVLPRATILKVIYKYINKVNYAHTITALNPTHTCTVPIGKHNSNLHSTERESNNTIMPFHFTHTLHTAKNPPKCICSRWKFSRVFRFPLSYSLSPALFLCLGTWIPSCADYTQSSLKAYFSCLQISADWFDSVLC